MRIKYISIADSLKTFKNLNVFYISRGWKWTDIQDR